MHGATVVPHENISGAPAVGIDVVGLRRVFYEFANERPAIIFIHVDDVIGMRLANIK